MALNIDKYGIREVCDLKFYKIDDVIGEGKSLETASPVFVIDSAILPHFAQRINLPGRI